MSRKTLSTAKRLLIALALLALLMPAVQFAGPTPVAADDGDGLDANLVRTIDISAGGDHTRMLLGDVSGNGRMEIVTMQADYMSSDAYTAHYVQCLTAFDIATGEMLWQIGTPETRFGSQATDIPAQIYDIDGDGYNEVLAIMNQPALGLPSALYVFDGRTAEVKASRPLPTATARDAIMIANLRGLDFPQDIVLKDRYNNQWAYSYDPWELLWHKPDGGQHGLGHYPWPYDWDGDGRDEIMAGFRLLAPDGNQLWRVQGLADHADSMWIGDMNLDGEPEIVIGGGTNAVVLYSKEGYEIWRTEGIRESQNVFMGKFRSDLPGLQVAGLDRVNRSSGPAGQDALFLIGYDGELLWHEDRPARGELGCWGTVPEPIHSFSGSGLDEILTWFRGCGVLPGIYNGYGERVATIEQDGRMMRGNVCGDAREEVIVYLGGDRIFIYSLDTCSDLDGPAPGTPLPQTQPRVQYNYTRYTAGSTPLTVEPQPRVPEPVAPGTNLALGKPKTASDSRSATVSAMNANDDDPATYWEANTRGAGQWWAVDLGAVYHLTGSEVVWPSAWPYGYKVEVSDDSTNWTLALDKTENANADQTQSEHFCAAGRFVRVTVTGLPSATTRARLHEFRLFVDEPPVLNVAVSPDQLWPPNHKYVTVQATLDVSDDCDPNPTVELVSVTSDEPDNGEDDGDTVDDIVIVDDTTFKLRAERSGAGDGRVYTITYRVTDAAGNSSEASATVTVPLSLGEPE